MGPGRDYFVVLATEYALRTGNSLLSDAVAGTETASHTSIRFVSIHYSHMTITKKRLVGITALALAVVYSLRRWRRSSPETDDTGFDTEQASPTAD
jgi:hypothetical protein